MSSILFTIFILECIGGLNEYSPGNYKTCAAHADKGIVISGGGALLRNLDLLIKEVSRLPVTIAENPLTVINCHQSLSVSE